MDGWIEWIEWIEWIMGGTISIDLVGRRTTSPDIDYGKGAGKSWHGWL